MPSTACSKWSFQTHPGRALLRVGVVLVAAVAAGGLGSVQPPFPHQLSILHLHSAIWVLYPGVKAKLETAELSLERDSRWLNLRQRLNEDPEV